MKKSMIISILSLVFLISSCAHIPERKQWTTSDKNIFIAACAANAYDFHTTKRYVLDRGGYIIEPWPTLLYLGDERPNTNMFAFSKAAQLGLAWIVLDRIESKWRTLILTLVTGTWIFFGYSNTH